MKRGIQLVGIIFSLFLVQSCASSSKLMDKGNYDEAFIKAGKKLDKKDRREYKEVFEQAFSLANRQDIAEIDRLLSLEDDRYWTRIYTVSSKIEQRNAAMIRAMSKYPDLEAVLNSMTEIKKQAAEGASKYSFNQGLELMPSARSGNKDSARKANAFFEASDNYGVFIENASELKAESRELGITRVYLDLDNRSRSRVPSYVYNSVEDIFSDNIGGRWIQLSNSLIDEDYVLYVTIDDFYLSSDIRRVENREYSSNVTDYVRDSNGSYVRDSLGNRITEVVRIQADVRSIERRKEAELNVSYRLFDAENRSIVQQDQYYGDQEFSSLSSTIRGDNRAIPDSVVLTRNSGRDFPSDREMLRELVQDLTNDFDYRLRNLRL